MANFSIILPETGLTLIGKVYNSSGAQQGSDVTMTESATNVYTGTYDESSLASGTYDEFPVLFSDTGIIKGDGLLKVENGVEVNDRLLQDILDGGSAIETKVDTIDGIVDAILVDTNELQTNQGNWLTATGFATPTDVTNAQSAIISEVDANETKIDALETKVQADARQVLLIAEHDSTQSDIAALNNISTADVAAELATYDAPTKAELDSAFNEIKGVGWTTETLKDIRDSISAGSITVADIWSYATRELTDKTGFELTSGERDNIAIRVEAALIDELDGQQLLDAIVTAIGNTNVNEVALVAAIRADLERVGGDLDLIKAATDNLPVDPASETTISSLPADILATELETGFTVERTLRAMASVLAGKASNGPSGSIFRNISDTGNMLTTSSDNNGDRSVVTISA